MQEEEELCVAGFIIDVIGTLQNSYDTWVRFNTHVADASNTESRPVGGKFLAPDLIYLFRSNDRRHSLRLIPSRSDSCKKKKHGKKVRCIVLGGGLSSFAVHFRRHPPLSRSFSRPLWQPVGSLIFHRSSRSYSADFRVGRNKRATNFCGTGAVRFDLTSVI